MNKQTLPGSWPANTQLAATRRRFIALFLGLPILFALQFAAHAGDENGIVVVVNASSTVTTVSSREIRKLFMGKSRKLPNGSRAVLASFGPVSSEFNRAALDRSDSEVTAAWSRLRFSGKTKPPREFSAPDELLAFVANTPNAIAYLPASIALDGEVKSVHSLLLP